VLVERANKNNMACLKNKLLTKIPFNIETNIAVDLTQHVGGYTGQGWQVSPDHSKNHCDYRYPVCADTTEILSAQRRN